MLPQLQLNMELKTKILKNRRKEINKKFSEGVITLQSKEYAKMLDEISVLTVVENVEEQVCRQDLLNAEFTA